MGHDGSKEMVKYAENLIGNRVQQSTFEDYKTTLTFDGLWASASLLHVPEDDMVRIIRKYALMLNTHGIFYMSFKKYKEHFRDEFKMDRILELTGEMYKKKQLTEEK